MREGDLRCFACHLMRKHETASSHIYIYCVYSMECHLQTCPVKLVVIMTSTVSFCCSLGLS